MKQNLSIKEAYGEALKELGQKKPNIIAIDADLQACSLTGEFAKACPGQQINVGIAECNMVGIAAGLATCGKIPFVHSFAMFTAGRAYDQIRNTVAYPGLNVKVMGMYAGFTNGEDGPTHQCFEDLTLMRAIPGMTVLCPCDAHETTQLMQAVVAYNGPCYIRMPRTNTRIVTQQPGYQFQIGKGFQLADGKDLTFIATGIMVERALDAAELLAAEGITARVVDMPTIKPLDQEIILKAAAETGAIVTAEDHNIMGGLGGAVAEVLAENACVPFARHGVRDQFGKSGKFEALMERYGLTAKDLAATARAVLAKKA